MDYIIGALFELAPLCISLIYLCISWKYRTRDALKWASIGTLIFACCMGYLDYKYGIITASIEDMVLFILCYMCPIAILLFVLSALFKKWYFCFVWNFGFSLSIIILVWLGGGSFIDLSYLGFFYIFYLFIIAALITIPLKIKQSKRSIIRYKKKNAPPQLK